MAGLINPKYALFIYSGTAITLGAIGGLFTRHEAVKIIGLTVLTRASFYFFSYSIAFRDCPEFCSYENKSRTPLKGRLLIMNENPDLNAAAVAMLGGAIMCPVGAFLALVARIPFSKFSYQISAKQLAPWMVASALITFVVAHWKARAAQAALSDPNLSLKEQLKHEDVSKKLQPGWEACTVRARISKVGFRLTTTLLTIGIIAARLGLVQNLLTKSRA